MSHTPGPWVAWNKVNGRIMRSWRVGERNSTPGVVRPIAVISNERDTGDEEYANARLIAAAPELLTALDMAVKYWRWMVEDNPEQAGDTERDELRWCEGILAKATGQ